MKKHSEVINTLCLRADDPVKKTAQLKQVLAQIEANISMKENQKVNEKSQKIQ